MTSVSSVAVTANGMQVRSPRLGKRDNASTRLRSRSDGRSDLSMRLRFAMPGPRLPQGRATLIAQKVDAAGRHVHQIELCEPHLNLVVDRETQKPPRGLRPPRLALTRWLRPRAWLFEVTFSGSQLNRPNRVQVTRKRLVQLQDFGRREYGIQRVGYRLLRYFGLRATQRSGL